MSRLLTLSLALALSACSTAEPVDIECSVDDTLVFVAPGATDWTVTDTGILVTYSRDDGKLFRRMQENETCRAVTK